MPWRKRFLRVPTVSIAALLLASIVGPTWDGAAGMGGVKPTGAAAAQLAHAGRPSTTQARSLAAPVGMGTGDIVLLGMSAFQAQEPNPGNDAPGFPPLVANKETMVRVWAAIDGSSDLTPRDVTVTLTAQVNNQTSPPCSPLNSSQTKSMVSVQVQGYTVPQYITEKLVPDLSLNFTFQLPSWCWWLDDGTIQLTATVSGAECPTCAANNVIFRDFTFHEVRKPIILLRPIVDGIPHTEFTLDGIDSFTSRFPISEALVYEAPTVIPPDDLELDLVTGLTDGKDGKPTDEWWEQYAKLRDWFADISDDDYPADAQVGILPLTSVKTDKGCWGISDGERYALAGAGCGGTYTHEIGHGFGLPHSSNDHKECDGGPCDKEWPLPHGGLGNRAWNRLSPAKLIYDAELPFGEQTDWHSHDLMSYGACAKDAPRYKDPNPPDPVYCSGWFAEHNYARLAQRLRCAFPQWDKPKNWEKCFNEEGPFAPLVSVAASPPAFSGGSGEPADGRSGLRAALLGWAAPSALAGGPHTAVGGGLLISASSGPDGAVDLRPFYRSAGRARPLDRDAPGSLTIELRGPGDRLLERRNVEPVRPIAHAPLRRWRLSAEVPWHPATQRILLKRGDTILAQRPVSAKAPTVRLLTPNGGERLGGNGQVRVEWRGEDPDGGALHYWLQYSSDGGRTWLTIYRNTRDTHYTLPLEQLAGSARARFRVLATDGVHTAIDESDAPFRVAAKPPRVGVHGLGRAPDDEEPRDPAILRGWAQDVEDGSLPEKQLTWTSDLEGQVGIGEALRLADLRPGRHRLTLTATDRDGQQGSATTTVTVPR